MKKRKIEEKSSLSPMNQGRFLRPQTVHAPTKYFNSYAYITKALNLLGLKEIASRMTTLEKNLIGKYKNSKKL